MMSLQIAPLVIDFSYIIVRLFNGLVYGMTLVLVALGLSLIFGVMGIINFSHGAFLLVGAYSSWFTWRMTGNIVYGFLVAILVSGIVGILVERIAMRRIYKYDVLLQILLTYGIAQFIRGLTILVWGRSGKTLPIPEWGQRTVNLVLFEYPLYRIFVIVATVSIVLALYVLIYHTSFGLIIRAGSQNRDMVGVLGVNISRIFLIVFGLGAATAGIGGALIGPINGVNPQLGVDFLIPSFVVVVIGGVGSLKGSVVAGILVGELMTLSSFVTTSGSQIVIYIAMIVVLLLRPQGLFGDTGGAEQ